jgi:type IV secretory pathway TrbD component
MIKINHSKQLIFGIATLRTVERKNLLSGGLASMLYAQGSLKDAVTLMLCDWSEITSQLGR